MKLTFLLIGLLISGSLYCQINKEADFFAEAKQLDFSDLWTLDSILAENEKYEERRPPLGFIGNDYQRLHIRFISVIQNPEDRLEYFVFGKTMVKSNICNFQGSIKVEESKVYVKGDFPPLKQGYITGTYKFFEDKDQIHTGYFSGRFQSNFYLDQNGKLQYDGLWMVADGFNNNQFEGVWTNYVNGKSQKCNWGDYRIPDSGDLDEGTAEFMASKKYHEKGWKNYNLAWGNPLETTEVKKAGEKERERWWMDK